jgi:thymidine kinase
MNSGKSADVLKQAYAYREQRLPHIVAKSDVDKKGDDTIESRALATALKVDLLIPEEADIREMILGYIALQNVLPRIIITDESQFFTPKQVDGLWEVTKRDGIPVHAYGLRTDFQGNLFPGSRRLFELADTIERRTLQVCRCGTEPNFNIRLHDGLPVFAGEQVSIDGQKPDETYEAVCGDCFLAERDKYEQRMADIAGFPSS